VLVVGAGFAEVQPLVPNLGTPEDCAARFLASQGYAVFAPGYRAADGTWPSPGVLDVEHSVQWLRQPAQLSAFGLDAAHFGALGTSAGGLIVGLLGASTADPSFHVQAVATWSGPMDLTDAPSATPADVFGGPSGNVLQQVYEVQQELLGCQPYLPQSMTAPYGSWVAQPACLAGAAADASPIDQAGAGTAPLFMANAESEGVLAGTGACSPSAPYTPPALGCFGIPVGQAQAMEAKLASLGITSKLDVVSDPALVGLPCSATLVPLATMHVDYAACDQTVWDDTLSWFLTYLPVTPAGPPIVVEPTFTG